MRTLSSFILLGCAPFLFAGCASSPVPDVNGALAEYREALAAGDAASLHAMMTEKDQKSISRAELAEHLRSSRPEMKERAELVKSSLSVKTEATILLNDGESVGLVVEDRAFRVTAGGTLPGGAPTPEGALGDLRRAILRREFGGVLRTLTPSVERTVESDLASLAKGLEHPETLPLEVKDDRAEVRVAGGHLVKLKRVGGSVWYVDYFD